MAHNKQHAIQPVPLKVIGAGLISRIINERYSDLEQLVIDTYKSHHNADTINPDSYFLRYPEHPNRRIIALPAHIGGQTNTSGIKWIASFPDNIESGLQRASASLVLNNGDTGYPIAFMESSIISATRTVLSATAGLYFMNDRSRQTTSLGIIGAGFIAKKLVESLIELEWQIDEFLLFDLKQDYATSLSDFILTLKPNAKVTVMSSLESTVRNSAVLATATTAGAPYISEQSWLSHNPIIVNLSLRDFSPSIILASNNIFDDIDHCLKANTSPHLAYLECGNKDFINGHFGNLLDGSIQLNRNKPTIFSPFGLGVLDIALGHFILNASEGDPEVTQVDNFFGDHSRW